MEHLKIPLYCKTITNVTQKVVSMTIISELEQQIFVLSGFSAAIDAEAPLIAASEACTPIPL